MIKQERKVKKILIKMIEDEMLFSVNKNIVLELQGYIDL